VSFRVVQSVFETFSILVFVVFLKFLSKLVNKGIFFLLGVLQSVDHSFETVFDTHKGFGSFCLEGRSKKHLRQ